MMGMGTLEILVILLVAFIFVGPRKMLDAARSLGKLVHHVRRLAEEIPHIDLDDEENFQIKSIKTGNTQAESTVGKLDDRSATSEFDNTESPVPFKEIVSPHKEVESELAIGELSLEDEEDDKPAYPTGT